MEKKMAEESETSGGSTQIERRTIIKGAAWTVPVIAGVTAAPTAAASVVVTDPPAVSLNGWMGFTGTENNAAFEIRSNSHLEGGTNQAGFWVTGTNGDEVITDAHWTLWFTRPIGPFIWNTGPGFENDGMWTTPAAAGTATVAHSGTTVYGYRSFFTGSFNVQPGQSNASPYVFEFVTANPPGGAPLAFYLTRTVTVDGHVISFTRGPVNWWGANEPIAPPTVTP